MKLSELLKYTAEQYLDDRTDLVDGDPDELWSDAFLVRQFNEAQRILCRRAWVIIEEGVAPAGRITLVTGQPTYKLHASVLRVELATPTDQVYPLWPTSDTVLRSPPRPSADAPFDINTLATADTGRPIAFATDAGTRTMRVYRIPTATENGLEIALKVARLPVTWLTMDNTDGVLEVPEDYHVKICEYAAGKALTLPNVDGQFRTLGRELLAEFDTEVKEARRDRQRAEMEPTRWGFNSATAQLAWPE